ncbi:MAG: S-layer homology domain-containing protein [Clostridiales bacterium]|nr:S-layer homology domain-containing protein [Clostridiales bacterium]
MFSTSFMCAASAGDAIENGGFENGINEFGICYSGRQDTALPSLYVTKEIASDGNYALEFLPGEDLGTESSISPASDGFAYQGVYNKKSFSMESGKKYTISANVYPKNKNVKMRFMVFSDGKLLESSEEFTVSADNWNQPSYAFTPDEDFNNVKIRMGFYDIDEGKSVFIDEVSCKEAIAGTSMWKPRGSENISISNNTMSFAVNGGKSGGIYCQSDKNSYGAGKYALVGTVSTDANSAYLIFNCPSVSGAHSEYVLKKGEEVNAVLVFDASKSTDDMIHTQIDVVADSDATVTLKNVEIVDMNYFMNVSQADNAVTISGQLKSGNENKSISISVSDIGTFNVRTNSDGAYTISQEIPAFTGIRKLVRAEVSGMSGYNDVGNVLSTDFYVTNTAELDAIAASVNACTTAAAVSDVLTQNVLDDMGVSAIPVVISADKNKIFNYLAAKDISDGKQLMDAIKTAACYDVLDRRVKKLTDIVDEYADILNVNSIEAYKDLYQNADKTSLNTMFEQSPAKLKDFDTFEYALTETIVRCEVNTKVTAAQQMAVIQKYAEALNLDFDGYSKLSSDKQYNVTTSLMNGIKNVTDYSTLQARLDSLVASAGNSNTGGAGGSGGSGSSGGSGGSGGKGEFNSYTVPPDENKTKEFRFNDIDSVEWAQESIYALAEKGVISKADDNRYNPHNNITRAEFAKMVSVLFGITQNGEILSLNDVKESDWYYPYVAALYANGIVNGVSQTEFGSNAEITRQDICVILANILKPEEDAEAASFTDIDEVADYAKNAVSIMKKRGVINGYEDGSFRPKGYATRAEVAKMLYEISK